MTPKWVPGTTAKWESTYRPPPHSAANWIDIKHLTSDPKGSRPSLNEGLEVTKRTVSNGTSH